jgi:regulator of protease activity HflC (stomatin/prohibitin superfamily)
MRNKQARESLMLTDDENIIDIQFAVQFKLKDPVAWLLNNRDEEDTVRQVAETSIREIVGKKQDGLRAVRRPRQGRLRNPAADAADPRPLRVGV